MENEKNKTMKINLKRDWMLWILILAPLVPVLLNWDKFPDKIPTHWGMDGEVDSYGGKSALFLGPVINFAIYLLLIFVPRIDPRAKNYELFTGAFWWIRLAITVLLSMFGFITAFVSLGIKLDVGLFVQLGVILLFLVIGNQFGRIRPNYFVGIRTPWTLNNEEVWMKTHRLGGRIWVIGSLIMLPVVFLFKPEISVFIFLAYIGVLVAFPLVYSYSLHKRITKGD
jgi:uncharacterized membrane protein